MDELNKYDWWGELKHGGMIISPTVMKQSFNQIYPIHSHLYDNFRDRYMTFQAKKETNPKDIVPVKEWIDYIFEYVLGYADNICRGKQIIEELKVKTILGKKLSPDRVIVEGEIPVLFIKFCEEKNIGIGKGRRSFAEFLELLRENKKVNIGIITNGDQIRLCHVGNGHEAWVEWNIENWFVEDEYRNQLYGFLKLVGKAALYTNENEKSQLTTAIEDSRNKQGELSSVLGEQVREAVEILITTYENTCKANSTIDIENKFINEKAYYESIYQGATRIIMRMVVLFFAESRGMLPRDIVTYNNSYGLEGLYEQLKLTITYEGKNSLKDHFGAWRRILSLFKLLYHGSGHQTINLQAYGGELFQQGNFDSEDDILKVLALYEHQEYKLSDYDVFEILEKLKVGRIRIKEGNKFIWVKGPVDFSDLRTEYIGIMYEGLLDYSLNRAKEPMLVLNAGDQPILPISHLELLKDSEIKQLFKAFKATATEEVISEGSDTENTDDSNENSTTHRVIQWALRCIELLKIVKKTTKMDDYEYKKKCLLEAERLVIHIYEEGDFYLIKAGGTRKGTGTYYTKPGLTIPTVRRTLEPLVYYTDNEKYIPKEPEIILALKVCDPACGSGSFLVAATEYIADVLTESMLYYKRFEKKSTDKTRILPYGTRSKGLVEEETLSVTPDNEFFEEHLRARLMRYVVERCIYGVDINAMAVELARLSLWIDTMNDELPFTFLDHKIKQGNALVGATFNNFRHYPIQAWNRDGGDSDHDNGVHYEKKHWNKQLKEYLKNVVKPELVDVIESYAGTSQIKIDENPKNNTNILEKEYEQVIDILEEFHNIPMSANGIRKREVQYREKIRDNTIISKIKYAFDTWCSIWFWPEERLDKCPTPKILNNHSDETKEIIKRLIKEVKFFHWELEFADVFAQRQSGFDAIIGNPPWNIAKPNSVEFFSYYDPMYRTYDKQAALKKQKQLYGENKEIEKMWLRENSYNKAMSNWVQNLSNPFGYTDENCFISLTTSKQKNQELHHSWAFKRNLDKMYTRNVSPYQLQGTSDINLYKLFLEQAIYILNDKGRLGVIIPSGIYSDKGTKDLREFLLNKTEWNWLFGFENREKIFDIHGSFKFVIILCTKGGNTFKLNASFMNRKIETWEKLNSQVIEYTIENINMFSPENKAFLEIGKKEDFDIIKRIYKNGEKIDIETSREFDMTNHSHIFIKNLDLIEQGYISDIYGRMVNNEGSVYYPLYQGTAIHQLSFLDKSWNNSKMNWNKNIYSDNPELSMQFYVKEDEVKFKPNIKLYYRSIARNTDTRTFIGTIAPFYPSGNSLNKITIYGDDLEYISLSGILNSFIFDYLLRNKLSGTNVNSFILKEIPLVKMTGYIKSYFCIIASQVQLIHHVFSVQWIKIRKEIPFISTKNIYKLWGITEHERLRLRCILDSLVTYSYGLNSKDLSYILSQDENNALGFWRVDKDKPLEVRQTTLTLKAFEDLMTRGIENFITNEWQLPDYAAEYYGEQYLPWQLEKSAEESWKECEEHARAFLGEEMYEQFIKDLEEE